MQIREATESDIPEILKVLKASLGESSSEKTEVVWRFKHIDNPFGKSLVLVAEEAGVIVGVRAFMRWKWQCEEKVHSVFRAVDTATHPNHQGKGIFKKLTIKALELAKERDDHFVFNTPNSQSKPGYLKMGWKEVSKLVIQIRPLNPVKLGAKDSKYYTQGNIDDSKEIIHSYFESKKSEKRFFTPKDIDYLTWRYVNNPLQDYWVIFEKEYFLAGYVKNRGRFNEFRVSEVIISENGRNLAKSAILKMAGRSNAALLSISPNCNINFRTGITGNFGPVLTFRNINLNTKKELELSNLSAWDYSLGDLELF